MGLGGCKAGGRMWLFMYLRLLLSSMSKCSAWFRTEES
jgi:hypothetical protein